MRQETAQRPSRPLVRRALLAAFATPALLVSMACSSVTVDLAPERLPPAVFGGWVWVQTTVTNGGETQTPETEGFSMTFNISQPNAFELLRDATLISSGTIEFVPENAATGDPAQFRYSAIMLGAAQHFVEFDAQGDLVLTDTCCGELKYKWRRL